MLCGVLFSASLVDAMLAHVALLLALGTIGFAAVGCVFSAALLRARGRDALLSTLLYPIIVPIVIAGARGTSQLIDRDARSGGRPVLDAVPDRRWTCCSSPPGCGRSSPSSPAID